MTTQDFLPRVEAELQARFVPFDRGHLRAFLEAAWPLVEDDPDPLRWAREFVEAAGVEA